MVGASKAQRARLEVCVSAVSNAVIVGFRSVPFPSRRSQSAGIYSSRLPSVVGAQIFSVHHEENFSYGSRLFNTGHRSTRPRDFRE